MCRITVDPCPLQIRISEDFTSTTAHGSSRNKNCDNSKKATGSDLASLYFISAMYAMRSARSFSFLMPAKTIFVPGMYFLGFSKYSNKCFSDH